MPLISIEVTPDIASKIRSLAEAGVFAIKTGNATVNLHEGVIKSIKTEYFSYPQNPALESIDIAVPVVIMK